MSKMQISQRVELEEVQRRLSSELGSAFRVTVGSPSSLKVGRPGAIPSVVKLSHAAGGTSFEVRTTGLIVSRLIQAAAINPQVRRALVRAFSDDSTA